MSKIFELFGYPLEDSSPQALENRHRAWCPFMDRLCDGGGNRPQSSVNLREKESLKAFFGERTIVPSGLCSLQLIENERPWVVCPRRLLSLKRESDEPVKYQQKTETILLNLLSCEPGTRLGVWAELGLKFKEKPSSTLEAEDVEVEIDTEVSDEEEGAELSGKSFDYRFDYIIMPVKKVPLDEVSNQLEISTKETLKYLKKGGYSLTSEQGIVFVDDFPYSVPYIIEIMTSSTSGGNKQKRTTVPMAFEDAILGKGHQGPGINYRQVWARMVSQLIVKSEVALGWGGKTIWVLQDTLVDYISSSTALDIRNFASKNLSEVNILSLSYGNDYKDPTGVIDIVDAQLFSGLIDPAEIQGISRGFLDILRTPIRPSLKRLVAALSQKKFTNILLVPD